MAETRLVREQRKMIIIDDELTRWQKLSQGQKPLSQEDDLTKRLIWRFASALIIVGAIILSAFLLFFLGIVVAR